MDATQFICLLMNVQATILQPHDGYFSSSLDHGPNPCGLDTLGTAFHLEPTSPFEGLPMVAKNTKNKLALKER